MTFCVSHQKQLDSDDVVVADNLVIQNDVKNDTRLNHPNITENTILGKHEKRQSL